MLRFAIFLVILLAMAYVVTGILQPAADVPEAFAERLTLDEARTRAEATGKPMLVFATADWCGPCQRLKRNALSDERVTRVIRERTIPVYYDLTRVREDRALADEAHTMGIEAFPTLLLIYEGRVISRQVGPVPAVTLLSWLEGT